MDNGIPAQARLASQFRHCVDTAIMGYGHRWPAAAVISFWSVLYDIYDLCLGPYGRYFLEGAAFLDLPVDCSFVLPRHSYQLVNRVGTAIMGYGYLLVTIPAVWFHRFPLLFRCPVVMAARLPPSPGRSQRLPRIIPLPRWRNY
jgi:hypothetical protein